jgi:uncharacterized protein YdhG (YjbR/CyaY superfamily)
MHSPALTVDQYLESLPEDRRLALEVVRKVLLKNLDRDYEECVQYGMIGYCVPHRVYPAGYHCDPKLPLPFAALGSQKNHMALYLNCVYGSAALAERFRERWRKTGKKLDMGKACIRFRHVEDLALDVIGQTIREVPARKYIEQYEATLNGKAKPAKPKASAARRGRGL